MSALAACSNDPRIPVVLYSPHGRDQLTLLERAFEAERPDIDVRWLDMGSQEILDRLRFERVNPQADVWFGGPTTMFDHGISDSLLQPYRPSWADRVGPNGVGPGDLYYPVYRTPAVIAYNNKVVRADEAPHDWDEVLAPRWRDKVVIRDPMASGTMRAIWGLILVRSIRETGDTARGMDWLRRLDAGTKTYALNPAILDAKLARAEGLVTLWDLPDILIGISKGLPFGYTFPRSGTVVIDDAIGLVRGSRHPAAARAFIDYVGGIEAQLLAAQEVFRLPARHDLPSDRVPAWVAEVEADMVVAPMDWRMLAERGSAWMGYWDRHVRGGARAAAR
ncbi:MAG TPA: extracellular solute-binding protein [Gemmatimonadales bacterium]|jgi:iron(III) transport system substrate-binding protein|nr:extracellular solute-binding protein [Gemmatimonadales bacterium]